MARITPQSQTCGTTLLPPLSQESPAAPQPGPGQSLWPAHWLLPTALPTQTEPPSLVSLDCRSLLEPEHLSDGLSLGPGHIPEEESRRQEAGSSSVSPGGQTVTFIKMPPRKFPKETKGGAEAGQPKVMPLPADTCQLRTQETGGLGKRRQPSPSATGSGGCGGTISGSSKAQLWGPEAQGSWRQCQPWPPVRSQNISDASRPLRNPLALRPTSSSFLNPHLSICSY